MLGLQDLLERGLVVHLNYELVPGEVGRPGNVVVSSTHLNLITNEHNYN